MLELVTERLVLRPLQVDDAPAFAAYRSDPDVARYQSWDTTYAPADAERLVASQDGVALGDLGVWLQSAAVDRVSGALCGDCAVRIATDQPQTAEVGVTFAPATQGSGLATEALGAVVTRLFEQHGVHRAFAQADDRNVPRPPPSRTAGLPVRGTTRRSRLDQGRMDHASHLRVPAPRMESLAVSLSAAPETGAATRSRVASPRKGPPRPADAPRFVLERRRRPLPTSRRCRDERGRHTQSPRVPPG